MNECRSRCLNTTTTITAKQEEEDVVVVLEMPLHVDSSST